jgi:putative ABC transport system substrate-binding protein
MIDRRAFLRVVAGSLVAAPAVATAQAAAGMPVVGFIGPPVSADGLVRAFQDGLRELGYVDGQNIRIEYRANAAITGNSERLAQLVAEVVALRPAVLVVSLAEVAVAAKKATSTIPIVMVNVADPVALGLVATLARPGGNVTGLSRQSTDIISKQFQLLKEIVGGPARIGVLLNPLDSMHATTTRIVEGTARTLGVTAKIVAPNTRAEIDDAFAALAAARANALLVAGSGVFYLSRAQIAGLALRHRMPSMMPNREFVDAGGLVSYAASSLANYRRAPYFVDRILKGAKPADLPIEQPAKFEMIVNLRTAKSLGITMPPSVLQRADELLE